MKDSPLSKQGKQVAAAKNDKTKAKGEPAGAKHTGTLKAAKVFDPEDDAKKIHEAVKGWGTDEEPLIEILSHRSNEQRQWIKKKYKEKYKKVCIY